MNTKGLEWFGLPKRNTLHPLCVVLSVLTRDCSRVVLAGELRVWGRESWKKSRELVSVWTCHPTVRALPFIWPRGARTLSGAPTCGPGDILFYNVRIFWPGVVLSCPVGVESSLCSRASSSWWSAELLTQSPVAACTIAPVSSWSSRLVAHARGAESLMLALVTDEPPR